MSTSSSHALLHSHSTAKRVLREELPRVLLARSAPPARAAGACVPMISPTRVLRLVRPRRRRRSKPSRTQPRRPAECRGRTPHRRNPWTPAIFLFCKKFFGSKQGPSPRQMMDRRVLRHTYDVDDGAVKPDRKDSTGQ